MPASLDNLFYIGDFETALIEKNTDAIKDAFVDLRNDKANGVTTIDKDKTCETMNFGYDGVTVTLYEIGESGNQFRYTMLGKRK